MFRNGTILGLIIMFICLAIFGCGSGSTPTQPDLISTASKISNGSNESGRECLGYWILSINTSDKQVEITPMRTGDWHLNVVGVLNAKMGIKVVYVQGDSQPANGIFAFDITLKHPFGTKPELAGFDVKGILITAGAMPLDGLKFAYHAETWLENADGYTRWWNPTEFTQSGFFGYTKGKYANTDASLLTANVNPYKAFADCLDPLEIISDFITLPLDDENGRGVFKAGSSNTRRYLIKFPMNPGPIIRYGYAVDASWVAPSPNPPSEIPDDFPINANQPEAYKIDVFPDINTLYYDSESGYGGGLLHFWVSVWDWQGQEAGLNSLEIESVKAFSPELFIAPVDCVFTADQSGKANYYGDASQFALPGHAGDFQIAVKVESKNGPTYQQTAFPAPPDPISAWQVIDIPIIDPACDPDSNNDIGSAEDIDFHSDVFSYLCFAADSTDWYKLEIPLGNTINSGTIQYFYGPWTEPCEPLYVTDSDGTIVLHSSGTQGYASIDLTDANIGPGTYYIVVESTQDYGAFKYYLKTDIGLEDHTPNPLEMPLGFVDCDATWVNGDMIDEGKIFASGPGGTWCWGLDGSDITGIGRSKDSFNTAPAFYYPYMYYVENSTDNPAGIDLVAYLNEEYPFHLEDVISTPHLVECMTMDAERLYVSYDYGTLSFVIIYDYINYPLSPSLLATFEVPHNTMKMEIIEPSGSDSTTLITMNSKTMSAYDVEDTSNVSLIDETTLAGTNFNRDFDVDGDYIAKTYLIPMTNIGVLQGFKFDYSTGFETWGTMGTSGTGRCVTISNHRVCVEDGTNGITLIDISDKDNFFVYDSIMPITPVIAMDYSGSYMVAAESGPGLVVYNVSVPSNITQSARTWVLNNPKDVFITGDSFTGEFYYFAESRPGYGALKSLTRNYIEYSVFNEDIVAGLPSAIAGNDKMLALGSYDIPFYWFLGLLDPYNPAVNWSFFQTSGVTSIAATQDTVYVEREDHKMRATDVSDWPNLGGPPDFDFGSAVYNLRVHGNYMYGTDQELVPIFDVTDPLDPNYLGNYSYGGSYSIEDMEIHGNYMYLCTTDTLEIINIKNPTVPVHVGTLALPYAPDMKYIAVNNNSYGFVSDSNHNPVTVTLWPPNYPSIFDNNCFGAVSDLPTTGLVVYGNEFYTLKRNIGFRAYFIHN